MGDSSCQGSPGHCLGLGGHVRLPRGGDACHLVPRPEKGHRARPAGEGLGVGAGGEGRRGDSSDYCGQVSGEHQGFLGTLWGLGEAGQRLRLVLRTFEHILSLGNLPVALLCA